MIAFGSATSDAPSGVDAAKDAASRARLALRGVLPALAVVSVSAAYDDLDEIPRVLAAQLGNDVPIVGGTAAGAVIGTGKVASRGVSVVLVGGAGIAVATVSTAIASRDLVELVPAAQELAHSAEAAARAGVGAIDGAVDHHRVSRTQAARNLEAARYQASGGGGRAEHLARRAARGRRARPGSRQERLRSRIRPHQQRARAGPRGARRSRPTLGPCRRTWLRCTRPSSASPTATPTLRCSPAASSSHICFRSRNSRAKRRVCVPAWPSWSSRRWAR